MKNIHILVATGEWKQDQLRYRRHRLAEFLQKQHSTKEVIWLCPTPNQEDGAIVTLANGIKQWSIKDLLPQKTFRFGRYIDGFYVKKLSAFLSYLRDLPQAYTFHLWYTFPGFPVLAELFPWDKVIYDCSDLWAASMGGKTSMISMIRQGVISRAEERIIQRANTIFCTSDFLRKLIVEKVGSDEHVYTFENGVEYELFTKKQMPKEQVLPVNHKGTVLGFIGGIKPKLDFELIKQVAQKKREWLFLFVGPDGTNEHSEFKQLLLEENVLWTGSVNPSEVPTYMNAIDIGIMPYKLSLYNQAVFPLKLFEFLGAGKSVVGVHLPSTKKYAEEMVYTHLNTNHPDEFIKACEQLETYKNHEGYSNRRREMAKLKNWDAIFTEMVESLH